jgi:hypothetical protein
VKKEETGVALTNQQMGVEDLLSSDIKIPRALLMQKMSEFVDKEKAKPGQIVGSLECNVLGGVDKEFLFVPLYIFNTWVESENDKYKATLPRTRSNENLPFEEMSAGGVKITRTKSINVFCMALTELESGEALPYQISFRRTSFDAGRTLITLITKLLMFKKPIYNYVFSISANRQENDKGVFYTFDVSRAKKEGVDMKLDPKYFDTCNFWTEQVQTNKVVVDEEPKEKVNASIEDAPF